MLRFIPIVLFCIQWSAVANINYSAEAVDDQQNKLTAIIMNTVIEKCDDTETHEAHYKCIANSVKEILKANTFLYPEVLPLIEPEKEEYPLVLKMDQDGPLRKPEFVLPGPQDPDDSRQNDAWPLF